MRISLKLEEAIEQRGIEVDNNLHQDLIAIMDEHQSQMFDSDQYPASCFQKIFWDQQYRASKLKDSRSMKWEPAMLRLAGLKSCTFYRYAGIVWFFSNICVYIFATSLAQPMK